ncbi:MAG: DNA-directed RNA polymerase subunit P [Candidatus Micrarchaeia archaeon]
MYICLHCGKEIKQFEENFIRCPYCGYRVLSKARSNIPREVKTD